MLCEALEVQGDRYAMRLLRHGTQALRVHRIKRFDEPYGELGQQRIAGI